MNSTAVKHLRAPEIALSRSSKGRTLPQLLRDNARDMGDKIAIRSKRFGLWQSLNWAELYAQVCNTAAALDHLGLQPGQVICLISENREEAWITQMAAISLGAIATNVYPDAPSDELADVLSHSDAVFALGEDQEQIDKILDCSDQLACLTRILYIDPRGLWDYEDPRLMALSDAQSAAPKDLDIPARIAAAGPSDVAVYCYTSGTTGKPKAAMMNHDFILDNAYRLMGGLEIRAGGKYLSYISPAWAAEQFMGVALPILAPLILHFAEKPETVQGDLREIGPDFLMFTPRQWEMQASDVEARMMDAPAWRQRLYHWSLARGHDRVRRRGSMLERWIVWPLADQLILKGVRDFLGLTQVQAVLSGGSGLSADLFARYRAFGVPLGNLYGSSELGLISTHRPDDTRPETMGSLMPSDPAISPPMEAWIEGGELRLNVLAFSGYLKNAKASDEMGARETGFKTGDSVRLDESGALIFLDRAKDLRRLSTGHTYPPQFLENHLRSAAMVRDAIVIGDESRDCVVALINIDMEIAGRFAERSGLAFGTFAELSQLAPVRSEIARAVAATNTNVDPGGRITAFANLPKELDADEDELTRSRKLRRGAIETKYAVLIEGLFEGVDNVPITIDVTYQDGRKSQLSAVVEMNRMETAE
ncbi:AMP-binding protein [Marinobacter sp. ATCH36]|uniref:AMP-dependent synthetase/ligase n=1 Tax=Marinobacter sp. ATCH36 TaxID=2945106 RepID=UPI002020103E|nr:AMP-binding protein [Marinobacter sp. ATCH36]MCL7946162.1 AMP-binding protein [Marinobacter sp. ATCH36]